MFLSQKAPQQWGKRGQTHSCVRLCSFFPPVINLRVEFIFHTHEVLDPVTTRGYSLLHECVRVCETGLSEAAPVNQVHLKAFAQRQWELTISPLSRGATQC